MPSKKVFIDGRMPSWRWKGNIPNESNYVFKDYLGLDRESVRFEPTVKKYRITTVLLPYQSNNKSADKLTEWVLKKQDKKKTDDIYTKLKKEGWGVVYEDGISVIYRRK